MHNKVCAIEVPAVLQILHRILEHLFKRLVEFTKFLIAKEHLHLKTSVSGAQPSPMKVYL